MVIATLSAPSCNFLEKHYYTADGLCKSFDGSGSENLRPGTSLNGGRSQYIPFGWCGMFHDPYTGRYHTHYREYDPVHARWLAEDPAGYQDGLNLYAAYMGVNRVDPWGLYDDDDWEIGDFSGYSDIDDKIYEFFGAMWEYVFGGQTEYVEDIAYDDGVTKVINSSGYEWIPPHDGIGGMTGGVVEAGTFRAFDLLEPYPTIYSRSGMEMGAGLVPIADPAARLFTGETVTGYQASRMGAGIELAIDCAGYYMVVYDAIDNAKDASKVVNSTQKALPPSRANPAYSWSGHRSAALAEEQLARTIHGLTDDVVIYWGDKIGTHGADVISINM